MARGQLTLLIIVGLIILIMVGIVIYAARSTSIKKGEQRVETQQRTSQLLKPVQDYVTQCLDLAARTTLEQMGKQGGVIEVPLEHITVDGAQVAYGLVPPQGNVGTLFFSETPDYPWGTFPDVYDGGTLILPNYTAQGYFGINMLHQLTGDNSMHDILLNATLAKTISCLDWTVFGAQGITVAPQTPSLSVVFGERATSFLLHYPVDVTSTVSGGSAKIDAFGVEIPVRFKLIIDAANAAIDKDATDITFDPSSLSVGDVRVAVQRDAVPSVDIITFTDPASSIGGHQYVFQTARQNRAPALRWIPNSTFDDVKLCDTANVHAEGEALIGDATACGTSSFVQTVSAIDPDEDALMFTFQVRDEPVMPPSPYTLTESDASFGILPINVRVSDGQLVDEQLVIIPTEFKPTP